MTHRPHVLIIGGGITGLSAAWELQNYAVDVTVLEADKRFGGKILSQLMPAPGGGQFLIDAGPESFVTRKPAAWQLTQELGLASEVINPGNEAAGTYVLDNGQIRSLPLSLRAFMLTDLLSWRGKLRMLAEPFIPVRRDSIDESLAAFVRRRLGNEALEKLIGPVLGGIYNSDPENLSILVSSPIMRELEAQGGLFWGSLRRMHSRQIAKQPKAPFRFFSFTAGTETLIRALTEQLQADLRLNAPVAQLEQTNHNRVTAHLNTGETLSADAVIITTTADVAANLLKPISTEVATQLSAIRHASIGTVSLAYSAAAVAHTAAIRGLMIPRREARRIDAVTWTSSKIPERAPQGYALLRVFFGGNFPASVGLSEHDLLTVVKEELADLLKIHSEPLDYRLARWSDSYPQADVGHLMKVAEIERLLPAPFYVTGSSYRGLSVPDCIQQGRETAMRVGKTFSSQLTKA